jgi:hypothetical protein
MHGHDNINAFHVHIAPLPNKHMLLFHESLKMLRDVLNNMVVADKCYGRLRVNSHSTA